MLLFGHMGITMAVGMLTKGALVRKSVLKVKNAETEALAESPSHVNPKEDSLPGKRMNSPAQLKNHFDYRVLLIGSLLPDLIDKPIGEIFFYKIFQSGRMLGHSLFFNLFIAALGIFILKRWRRTWLLVLSFGSIMHLALDAIWFNTKVFLWPLYGWSFAKTSSTDFFGWLPRMLHRLITEPSDYIPEIIGLGILVWFTITLFKEKKVYAFIRNGLAYSN